MHQVLKDWRDRFEELGIYNKNVVISFSGGLDATTLLASTVLFNGVNKVHPITFNYGQRNIREIDKAIETCKLLGISDHRIIELKYLHDINKDFNCSLVTDSKNRPKTAAENSGDPQIDSYVSFRNLQFGVISAAYAESIGSNYVLQGINATDEYSYWDTTHEYTNALDNILQLNRENPIRFIGPLLDMYKSDIYKLAYYLSQEFGFDILKHTWSCYNGDIQGDKECGVCNTCREKITGLKSHPNLYNKQYILDHFENI